MVLNFTQKINIYFTKLTRKNKNTKNFKNLTASNGILTINKPHPHPYCSLSTPNTVTSRVPWSNRFAIFTFFIPENHSSPRTCMPKPRTRTLLGLIRPTTSRNRSRETEICSYCSVENQYLGFFLQKTRQYLEMELITALEEEIEGDYIGRQESWNLMHPYEATGRKIIYIYISRQWISS